MKTERKISSINHIFLITTLVMWCWAIGSASAEECPDLIVDYEDLTVDGGCYGIIFIKNGGRLTVNGDVIADIVLVKSGELTCGGSWSVNEMTVEEGIVHVRPESVDIACNFQY